MPGRRNGWANFANDDDDWWTAGGLRLIRMTMRYRTTARDGGNRTCRCHSRTRGSASSEAWVGVMVGISDCASGESMTESNSLKKRTPLDGQDRV